MLAYQRVYRFPLALLDLRGAGVEELRRSATFMARRGNVVYTFLEKILCISTHIKSHYIWQTFDIVVPIINQQENHIYNSGTDHQPKGVAAHCPVGHVGKSQTMDKLWHACLVQVSNNLCNFQTMGE